MITNNFGEEEKTDEPLGKNFWQPNYPEITAANKAGGQ
jgi:hypothetical protein